MFISLEILEQKPLDFREEFAPDSIELGFDMRQSARLSAQGRATLLEEHHGPKGDIEDIRVVGSFATQVQVACARCLEAVTRDIQRSFDLLYRPQGADAGRAEISVTQAEADIGYYTGEGVLLEDVLREQILLEVPLKTVCREECKGLCPNCGQNLNEAECACQVRQTDERWEALRALKDKLKE